NALMRLSLIPDAGPTQARPQRSNQRAHHRYQSLGDSKRQRAVEKRVTPRQDMLKPADILTVPCHRRRQPLLELDLWLPAESLAQLFCVYSVSAHMPQPVRHEGDAAVRAINRQFQQFQDGARVVEDAALLAGPDVEDLAHYLLLRRLQNRTECGAVVVH